jgi:RNA ligase (TIGR02306 family)
MRKLASIQRITAIDPIPNADAIEVASVLGWKVVVKKDEFKVGDLAVYMEIDSVPPDVPEYAFLWKNTEMRPNNFRIRTVKLRGQISQGILFSLGVLGRRYGWGDEVLPEGYDVSEMLKVTKYEAPLPAGSNDIAGQFFDGVPKTDEERVQSETGMRHLEDLQGLPYVITVKLDGSSMTVAMHDEKVKVASRNYRLKETSESSYWSALTPGLRECIEDHPHFAIQGELCGPGIQNNRLGLSKPTFFGFTLYDRNAGQRLGHGALAALGVLYGFGVVPILEMGVEFNYAADELLVLAEGKYEGTQNEREGIVIRCATNPSLSFKAISNRYLLKGGE